MFILSSVIFSIIVNNYVKLTCTNERFNLVVFFYSGADHRPHTPDPTP